MAKIQITYKTTKHKSHELINRNEWKKEKKVGKNNDMETLKGENSSNIFIMA